MNKSPNCEMNEIDNVINTISERDIFTYKLKNLRKKGIKSREKINDPTDPDIVLFGLILVNFFPLNVLPKIKPPISVIIETEIE